MAHFGNLASPRRQHWLNYKRLYLNNQPHCLLGRHLAAAFWCLAEVQKTQKTARRAPARPPRWPADEWLRRVRQKTEAAIHAEDVAGVRLTRSLSGCLSRALSASERPSSCCCEAQMVEWWLAGLLWSAPPASSEEVCTRWPGFQVKPGVGKLFDSRGHNGF